MFNRVLVSIDLKEFGLSRGILPYVTNIARGLNMPVTLCAIVNPEELDVPEDVNRENTYTGSLFDKPYVGTGGMYLLPPDRPLPGRSLAPNPAVEPLVDVYEVARQKEFEVKSRLADMAEQLGEMDVRAGVSVSTSVDVASEILRQAEERGCDLIAMATHDRNLLGQAIKGSVTNEVARSSNVPVLAIAPENRGAGGAEAVISRILVPLDGSPFAESALPYAEHMAREMGLELRMIHVIQASEAFPDHMSGPASRGERAGAIREGAGDDVGAYLDGITRRLEDNGVNACWQVLRDSPEEGIASMAEAASGSIIVMASHSRSGISRWVMGSMAEDLLRDTGVPMLIVPAKAAQEDQ
jgi:nucleotide-binding universal stress UspA family protein